VNIFKLFRGLGRWAIPLDKGLFKKIPCIDNSWGESVHPSFCGSDKSKGENSEHDCYGDRHVGDQRKVHNETVRSGLRMAIVQQSMEIDMWEIKEKLVERREQMAIRAYEKNKRREEWNQRLKRIRGVKNGIKRLKRIRGVKNESKDW
ncbi:hypothetical protein Tco_1224091, partial [Tanacetum coccineum]